MFTKIGEKLKAVAVAFCWIGMIASFIIAVVLWKQNSYRNPTAGLGFGVLIGGCLVSWLGSMGCYAIGQITEDIHALRITSDVSTMKPKYDEAMRQKSKKNYAEAAELFGTIRQYDDAAEQEKACRFLLAEMQKEAGKYKEAIQSFEAIGDFSYRETNECIKECWYFIGLEKKKQGKYGEAQEAFINAYGYNDAEEMILENSYLMANDFLKKGDIEEAYHVFMTIADYKDVQEILDSTPEFQDMKQEDDTEET